MLRYTDITFYTDNAITETGRLSITLSISQPISPLFGDGSAAQSVALYSVMNCHALRTDQTNKLRVQLLHFLPMFSSQLFFCYFHDYLRSYLLPYLSLFLSFFPSLSLSIFLSFLSECRHEYYFLYLQYPCNILVHPNTLNINESSANGCLCAHTQHTQHIRLLLLDVLNSKHAMACILYDNMLRRTFDECFSEYDLLSDSFVFQSPSRRWAESWREAAMLSNFPSFIHFIHQSIYQSIHSSIYPFIHPLIHQSIHSFIHRSSPFEYL